MQNCTLKHWHLAHTDLWTQNEFISKLDKCRNLVTRPSNLRHSLFLILEAMVNDYARIVVFEWQESDQLYLQNWLFENPLMMTLSLILFRTHVHGEKCSCFITLYTENWPGWTQEWHRPGEIHALWNQWNPPPPLPVDACIRPKHFGLSMCNYSQLLPWSKHTGLGMNVLKGHNKMVRTSLIWQNLPFSKQQTALIMQTDFYSAHHFIVSKEWLVLSYNSFDLDL